jgi:hypothetical protein
MLARRCGFSEFDGMRYPQLLCFRIGAVALLLPYASAAPAYTITIAATSPKAVYLQIGVGSLTGASNYSNGGVPGNTATINKASVTVPAAAGPCRRA